MRVVFLHGAGRSGPDAWPAQAPTAPGNWEFLERHAAGDSAERDAARIVRALEPEGGHVVSASYGGNAAVLAAQHAPSLVRSLMLFEPACFDLARGEDAVEDHIAVMDPVFEVAADPAVSAQEFSRRFAAGMGTRVPDLPPHILDAQVARLRRMAAPWGVGLKPGTIAAVPTLVVTGSWSHLYDQIADALGRFGARRAVVGGHGHRPQDAPGAGQLMRQHWAASALLL